MTMITPDLIDAMTAAAYAAAARYGTAPSFLEVEEIVSEALDRVTCPVKGWRPDGGSAIKTFAFRAVGFATVDKLRERDHQPLSLDARRGSADGGDLGTLADHISDYVNPEHHLLDRERAELATYCLGTLDADDRQWYLGYLAHKGEGRREQGEFKRAFRILGLLRKALKERIG